MSTDLLLSLWDIERSGEIWSEVINEGAESLDGGYSGVHLYDGELLFWISMGEKELWSTLSQNLG